MVWELFSERFPKPRTTFQRGMEESRLVALRGVICPLKGAGLSPVQSFLLLTSVRQERRTIKGHENRESPLPRIWCVCLTGWIHLTHCPNQGRGPLREKNPFSERQSESSVRAVNGSCLLKTECSALSLIYGHSSLILHLNNASHKSPTFFLRCIF